MLIHILLLVLSQSATVLSEDELCDEIFSRLKPDLPNQLKGTLGIRLNVSTQVDFSKDWEIEVWFSEDVELEVDIINVSRETGIIRSPDGSAKSASAPLTVFQSPSIDKINNKKFKLHGSWNGITNPAPIVKFYVQVKANYAPGFYTDLVKAKYHNISFCTGTSNCGLKAGSIELIVRGDDISHGEWPWLAAIYLSTNIQRTYQCVGTLLSTKHVLTAAHCFRNPPTDPTNLKVYLGKHELFSDFLEPEAQAFNVKEIIRHPDAGRRVNGKKDGDIAVLILSRPAQITDFVRPACLNFEYHSPEPGTLGTVVGWGLDESGQATLTPKKIKIPIVSIQECRSSDYRFINLTSERTFCAGYRNNSGPCSGDSGGGFYTPFKFLGDNRLRYHVAGVVSNAIRKEEHNMKVCDLSHYVTFTDVYSYRFWLRDVIGIPITWRRD